MFLHILLFFFFSSRRRHTRCSRDWSSDVCSSDLVGEPSVVLFWLRAADTLNAGDQSDAFDDLKYYTEQVAPALEANGDRKSTRLNSSHGYISYAVFCLKKKKKKQKKHQSYT